MKKGLTILLMAAGFLTGFAKKEQKANVLDLKHSITDNAIVYPESFEVDTQKLLESWFVKNYTATDDRYSTKSDVEVSDEEMIRRLNAMPTIIEMPYNQIVRNYIERYTKRGRPQVAALLGLSLYYMPIFEQALEEKGLPLELRYLPVIESSLDPNAVSKHGATGLWQFMLATAKGLGMEVNSLVDERRDPYVASEMAANYLKGLYDTYGDWSLAIAAYNCGPGNVNKALRRAGGETKDHDFWSIYSYLPQETRGYVPMFIAANYVMTYYQQHNISPVLPVKPLVMDTVQVNQRVHFNQISKVLDIPIEELRILNPQFRADIIPGSADASYTLILPSQQIHAYLMSEDDIINFEYEKYSQRGIVEPNELPADGIAAIEDDTDIWSVDTFVEENVATSNQGNKSTGGKKTTIVHKVEPGESLASIAQTYGVTPADIRQTNNLRRNAVRVGQQLRITTDSPQAIMETTVEVVTTQELGDNNQRSQQSEPSVNKPSTKTKKETVTAPKETKKPTKEPQPVKKDNKKDNKKENKKETQNNKNTKETKNPATHTLKNGDNLSSIAQKYGVSVDELKKANGLTDDKIKAGETLKIPSKNSKSNAKDNKNSKNNNNNKNTKGGNNSSTHTLQSGDNLINVAKKYGVSVDELKKANGLTGDKVKAGETLKIPKKSNTKKKK